VAFTFLPETAKAATCSADAARTKRPWTSSVGIFPGSGKQLWTRDQSASTRRLARAVVRTQAAQQIVCDQGISSKLPACGLGDEAGQGIAFAHAVSASIPGSARTFIEIRQDISVPVTSNKLTTAIGDVSKGVSVSIPERCGLRLHSDHDYAMPGSTTGIGANPNN
jgi:hypothetical protein